MSSNFNKTSGSRFTSGDQPVHFHEHSRPGEDIWQDDEYDSSLSRSRMNAGSNWSGTGHSTARRGSGDHVIYTEKVTKEYDAQGNVVKTNVEHPKPGALNAFDDNSTGRTGASGPTGSSTGISGGGRQPLVSDEYGQTGTSRLGDEAQRTSTGAPRERTVPGTQHTLGDKITSTGQKMMGKTTSNPQQYYEGESTMGKFNPLK
ncbi:hypothetical protein FA13DRAFT_1728696 [Coprinellus micaceus]|uniref:Uncharacterized protein n=1 Tax=Coprinellus micaceus TaxID=71717 RepID=A0A4Y7TNS5_COPMI|nr:hypothetical protein FA13DRAFT_1728696 [Coprinellus micaceus]